jgi:hypothetical protein
MIVGLATHRRLLADLVAKSSLIEVQTSLACPIMLAVMLLRFRLYSSHPGRHAHG